MQALKTISIVLGSILAAITIVAIISGPPFLVVMYMGFPFYMMEYFGALWVFILASIALGVMYAKGIV